MIDFTAQSSGILFAAFGVAAAAVLLCGVRLTRLADRFADLSGMGEAVIGAAFLGALTSLSGAVTSVTAAAQGHADLALSNAIGGIAVQTVFLVAADVAWRRANLEHAAASVPNLISAAMLILLLTTLLLAWSLPPAAFAGVHPATPVLFVLYGFGVHIIAQSNEKPMWAPDETDDTRQDVPDEIVVYRRSIARMLATILGLGAIVGLAGWVIAEAGLAIAARSGVREGLVGALLTSVVTSTPELVTTVAAVRRGALTLAVGGILGGNGFDVLIAAFSDIAYREGSIYNALAADHVFLVLVSIVMTAILILGLLRRQRHGPANIGLESLALLLLYAGAVTALISAF